MEASTRRSKIFTSGIRRSTRPNWLEAIRSNRRSSRSVSIDGHSGYGFGWYIREHLGLELISHGGDTIGFKTVIERFPEMHFTVIILINRNDGDPSGIARKIADFILFGAEVKHENSVPR